MAHLGWGADPQTAGRVVSATSVGAQAQTLRVNETEAELVRTIYDRYLAIGSVHHLAAALAGDGILSKCHVTSSGRELGGTPFGRGALFHLLRNRIYLGQIVHKELVHQGEHLPIIDAKLFERVQQHLAANRVSRAVTADRRTERAVLTGRVFDERGEPMSPAHSRGRSGRLYRYYVSASVQRRRSNCWSRTPLNDCSPARMPTGRCNRYTSAPTLSTSCYQRTCHAPLQRGSRERSRWLRVTSNAWLRYQFPCRSAADAARSQQDSRMPRIKTPS